LNPIVSIMMGSNSDAEYLKPCGDALREFNIPFEARVLSAHRTPVEAVEYVKNAEKNGVKIFICAAGGAAHLAGVVAAHTVQPVIGIPVESPFLHGLDSLLSTVQMPAGTPVATVGANSGGVKNAGYLAVRMLALIDPALGQALKDQKKKTAEKVLAKKVTL
jgi:phosphoribosylaminoimidazole carboxylase PurE protein